MPDDRAAASAMAVIGTPVSSIRVATYNIHSCVGVDRRHDPARIAAVLREIAPDIACLQEVDARRRLEPYDDQWAYLAEATGLRVVTGAGIREHRGRFANAILTRFPALAVRSIDLSVAGYEPRGAIEADLLVGERMLRVFATHFGLHLGERRLQANRLIAALGERPAPDRIPPQATLLMGDLNEWRGRSGGIRLLDRQLGPSAALRSFPSWMPVLPLDRIYADGRAMLRDVHVYRSPLARLASDHLPVVGDLCWSGDERAGSRSAERRSPRRRRRRPQPQPALAAEPERVASAGGRG